MKFSYTWTFVNKLPGGTPAPPPEKRTPALPRLPACRALSRQIGRACFCLLGASELASDIFNGGFRPLSTVGTARQALGFIPSSQSIDLRDPGVGAQCSYPSRPGQEPATRPESLGGIGAGFCRRRSEDGAPHARAPLGQGQPVPATREFEVAANVNFRACGLGRGSGAEKLHGAAGLAAGFLDQCCCRHAAKERVCGDRARAEDIRERFFRFRGQDF